VKTPERLGKAQTASRRRTTPAKLFGSPIHACDGVRAVERGPPTHLAKGGMGEEAPALDLQLRLLDLRVVLRVDQRSLDRLVGDLIL
jgi:hypothetical protein